MTVKLFGYNITVNKINFYSYVVIIFTDVTFFLNIVDGYGFKFKSAVQAVCIVEKQNGNVKQVLVVLGQS